MHAIFVIHKTALASIFTLKFKFLARRNFKPTAVILFLSWNHLHTINFTKDKSINCCKHLQQQGVGASHDYYINESNVSQPTFQFNI